MSRKQKLLERVVDNRRMLRDLSAGAMAQAEAAKQAAHDREAAALEMAEKAAVVDQHVRAGDLELMRELALRAAVHARHDVAEAHKVVEQRKEELQSRARSLKTGEKLLEKESLRISAQDRKDEQALHDDLTNARRIIE